MTATEITACFVAPVPLDTLPAIAVSDIQTVDMASVAPDVVRAEYTTRPKLEPLTVRVESCLVALLTLIVPLRGRWTMGESYDIACELVAGLVPDVNVILLLPLTPLPTLHRRVVSDTHSEDSQAVEVRRA